MGVTSKKWILAKAVKGVPTLEDFKLVQEVLPDCQDGDFITEAEHLSVDPYMRYRIEAMQVGDTIFGGQVAKVIQSKNADYPVGTRVVAYCGWKTHHLYRMKNESFSAQSPPPAKVFPEIGNLPSSTAVGVLGMPGLTAYFGFLDICKPKAGDVVVVNAAGGAVGSQVCQIAKIKGCKVIAFAGEPRKLDWLKELGIDCVANYKTEDISQVIAREAPNGVNCYFDNVGGEFTSKVLPHMAVFGSVSVCGGISTYNDVKDPAAAALSSPFTTKILIHKQLKVEGFLVTKWTPKWRQAVAEMKQWIDEGKLKYKETVTRGFEKMPEAFIGLFKGSNIGKSIVTI